MALLRQMTPRPDLPGGNVQALTPQAAGARKNQTGMGASSPVPSPAHHWHARGPLLVGICALVVLLGGILTWSLLTNISGAVVASGVIEVESNRQAIQHPEGGVVLEIPVRDGDVVKAGDVLLRLDGTRLRSELSIVEGQLLEISAREARLTAERDAAPSISFPPDLTAAALGSADVKRQLDGETTLFNTRQEALDQQAGLLAEQNLQIENRIIGIEAQLAALQRQLEIVGDELADQQRLLEQRLTQSARVLDLQRQQADLEGQIGRLKSEIAELRGQSASNAIAVLQLRTTRQEEAVTQLRDLQFSRIELTERRLALQETLAQLDLRAPMGGIVYNSQVFAVQSVIQPGQTIMSIVPQDQPLVVSARVNAVNVDEIFVGQEVTLRFSAFDQRKMPDIMGEIVRISADVITDEATKVNYYAVEIVPLEADLVKLGEHDLVPGMPVEAYIKTSERTAFTYLTQPLMSFFDGAFRE